MCRAPSTNIPSLIFGYLETARTRGNRNSTIYACYSVDIRGTILWINTPQGNGPRPEGPTARLLQSDRRNMSSGARRSSRRSPTFVTAVETAANIAELFDCSVFPCVYTHPDLGIITPTERTMTIVATAPEITIYLLPIPPRGADFFSFFSVICRIILCRTTVGSSGDRMTCIGRECAPSSGVSHVLPGALSPAPDTTGKRSLSSLVYLKCGPASLYALSVREYVASGFTMPTASDCTAASRPSFSFLCPKMWDLSTYHRFPTCFESTVPPRASWPT